MYKFVIIFYCKCILRTRLINRYRSNRYPTITSCRMTGEPCIGMILIYKIFGVYVTK